MTKRDDKRHRFALMMAAHRAEWDAFGVVQLTKAFNNDRKAIRSIFSTTDTPKAAGERINSYFKRQAGDGWQAALRTLWVETGKATIAYMHDFLTGKDVSGIRTKQDDPDPGVSAITDPWQQIVNDKIIAGGDKITGITDTTRDQVQGVIAQGVENGDSHYVIGQAVDDALGDSWAGRGEMISRTEANSAMNYASLTTSQATVPDLNKVWSTTGMENVRPWHQDADGQSVPQDQPFSVMDEDLMYPGDDSGSPENTINCACTIMFEEPPKEGEAE